MISKRSHPIRVLVVEDSPTARDFLVGLFNRTGDMTVVGTALDGEEGVRRAVRLRPDIVAMDIHMPRLDGLEATRILRSETDPRLASIPVIALTALAMPGDRERSLEAGANDYLSKPFSLKELTGRIEKLIRKD